MFLFHLFSFLAIVSQVGRACPSNPFVMHYRICIWLLANPPSKETPPTAKAPKNLQGPPRIPEIACDCRFLHTSSKPHQVHRTRLTTAPVPAHDSCSHTNSVAQAQPMSNHPLLFGDRWPILSVNSGHLYDPPPGLLTGVNTLVTTP